MVEPWLEPGPTTVGTPSSDRNPRIKARSDAIRGAFNSPASHRYTAEQTLLSQSASLARKRIRTASPNISDTNAGNPTVAGIFLFAPHVASRPARLCNGGIVPCRKALLCTIKRTSFNHAGRCGRDFSEDIPRNGKRTAQSITNLRTNTELVGASTTPLPLPRQVSPSLLDKKRRFRGSRFPRPASFVNLRTRYSPYFKLMGNNTPTNQQKRRPRRRRPLQSEIRHR